MPAPRFQALSRPDSRWNCRIGSSLRDKNLDTDPYNALYYLEDIWKPQDGDNIDHELAAFGRARATANDIGNAFGPPPTSTETTIRGNQGARDWIEELDDLIRLGRYLKETFEVDDDLNDWISDMVDGELGRSLRNQGKKVVMQQCIHWIKYWFGIRFRHMHTVMRDDFLNTYVPNQWAATRDNADGDRIERVNILTHKSSIKGDCLIARALDFDDPQSDRFAQHFRAFYGLNRNEAEQLIQRCDHSNESLAKLYRWLIQYVDVYLNWKADVLEAVRKDRIRLHRRSAEADAAYNGDRHDSLHRIREAWKMVTARVQELMNGEVNGRQRIRRVSFENLTQAVQWNNSRVRQCQLLLYTTDMRLVRETQRGRELGLDSLSPGTQARTLRFPDFGDAEMPALPPAPDYDAFLDAPSSSDDPPGGGGGGGPPGGGRRGGGPPPPPGGPGSGGSGGNWRGGPGPGGGPHKRGKGRNSISSARNRFAEMGIDESHDEPDEVPLEYRGKISLLEDGGRTARGVLKPRTMSTADEPMTPDDSMPSRSQDSSSLRGVSESGLDSLLTSGLIAPKIAVAQHFTPIQDEPGSLKLRLMGGVGSKRPTRFKFIPEVREQGRTEHKCRIEKPIQQRARWRMQEQYHKKWARTYRELLSRSGAWCDGNPQTFEVKDIM